MRLNFMKLNYKTSLSAVCLMLGMLSALPAASFATNQDAVKDSRNNYVRDSHGDCVRTKWHTNGDPCAGEVVQVSDFNYEFSKMEERKIYFDFDKSVLKDLEKQKLQVLADNLRKNNVRAVKIVGFTDRIGRDDYNHKLSHKRAEAVENYLNTLISLESSKVEVRGLGKSNQVKDCGGVKPRAALIECLAPNRRVEIELDYIATEQHTQVTRKETHTVVQTPEPTRHLRSVVNEDRNSY